MDFLGSLNINASNVVNLILTALTGFSAYWSYREQRKATYMQFYEIVSRHHMEELTRLRRDVIAKLPHAAELARVAGQSLIDVDPDLQASTSNLANYYEGLGMFLKGGWSIFPDEARTAMLDMLHNSVSRTWPIIQKYQAEIYPSRPGDWAGSYRWLYDMVIKYRADKRF